MDMISRLGFGRVTTAALFLLMGGCASAPFDAPREASYAEPPSRSGDIAQAAAPWFNDPENRSGIVPLTSGEEALGARLRLIERATHTIDAQYFLIKPDLSAVLITGAMRDAADRGVRVRFLVDDVFTTAPDAALAALDDHPNIEVRLYNPVTRSGPGWLAFLRSFPGSNRRMHNKSLTADNAMTIVGGRNIADEYYAIEDDIAFADFDVVAIGPAAPLVSRQFDAYWNSKRALPIGTLYDGQDPDTDVVTFDAAGLEEAREVYAEAVNQPLFEDLRSGRVKPFLANTSVGTDWPAKLGYPVGAGQDTLYREIEAAMLAAESEVVIVSPYFVPQRRRVEVLTELERRGVDVIVITNSLASNNHAYVHGGYFPYRKTLLRAGVKLWEAKDDSVVSEATGEATKLTLHSKVIIIDRKLAYVGSLNFDPRSIDLNTETGLFIDSPEFSGDLVAGMEENFPNYLYRLSLEDDDQIVWRYGAENDVQEWRTEPNAGFVQKITAYLAAILPVEGQL